MLLVTMAYIGKGALSVGLAWFLCAYFFGSSRSRAWLRVNLPDVSKSLGCWLDGPLFSCELERLARVQVLVGSMMGHKGFGELVLSLLLFALRVEAVPLVAGANHVVWNDIVLWIDGHHESGWAKGDIRR